MEIRRKWLEVLQLKNYEPKKTATVCSVHFKETDYLLGYTNRILKKDAVPHLLETEIQPEIVIQSDSNDLPIHCQLDSNNPLFQRDLGDQDHEIISIKENTEADLGDQSHEIISIEGNTEADLGDQSHEITSIEGNTEAGNTNKMVHRSTSVSPERIMNSPIKTRIRKVHKDEMTRLKRRLSISQYKHKKTQEKYSKLKNVLKDLQKWNLLAAEDRDILQHLDAGTRELIKRDISKRKK